MAIAVIPALNEENTIYQVVRETLKYVDKVIVVDDGSTDHTSSQARKAGAYVIRHIINRGQLAALLTGFKGGLMLGASILVSLDADQQHDPSEIPYLLSEIEVNNADLVIGSRVLGSLEEPSLIRRTGIKFFSSLFGIFYGVKSTDITSGFRALHKRVINTTSLGEDQYCSMLIIDAVRRGYRIKEVPIHTHMRIHGKSRKHIIKFAYKLLSMIVGS